MARKQRIEYSLLRRIHRLLVAARFAEYEDRDKLERLWNELNEFLFIEDAPELVFQERTNIQQPRTVTQRYTTPRPRMERVDSIPATTSHTSVDSIPADRELQYVIYSNTTSHTGQAF